MNCAGDNGRVVQHAQNSSLDHHPRRWRCCGGSSGGAGDNKSTSSTKAVAGKSKGSSSGGGTRGVDGFDGFNKRAGGEGAGARK